MHINFVGSFTQGYVGETSDESHLARELEEHGHTVKRVPRDIWKAHVEDGINDWPEITDDLKSDFTLVAKWHHFTDGRFIRELRERSGSPVAYWVWDHMHDGGFPEWHVENARAADIYLSNEGGLACEYKNKGIPFYYFPFDVSDKTFDKKDLPKERDVVFFGSCIGQGDRKEWIPKINSEYPVKIFSWNWQDWQKMGLTASPAVYGEDFAEEVAKSRICLQFSVNDYSWGYWSNRVGKVLTTGGFLLARYAPGMELFIRDGCAYFSSVSEAIDRIGYYLEHDDERQAIADRGYILGRDRFTSHARIGELCILMERMKNGFTLA